MKVRNNPTPLTITLFAKYILYSVITCTLLLLFLECSSNRILNESDRGQGYMQVVKCDRNLPKAWYRILGGAGTQMPDTCVHEQQCGTHAPGWLSGGHPTVAQGIVRRQVCFHWYSNCCQWSLNIRVRNCSAFYVYELIPTHGCSLRYCGDRKQGKLSSRVFLANICRFTKYAYIC